MAKPKAAAAANSSAVEARAQVFDALQKEMDIASYAVGKSGHKVKRVPRNQWQQRNAKRKALDDADLEEMAIEADDDVNDDINAVDDVHGAATGGGGDGGGGITNNGSNNGRKKRLRGSRIAFDDVILKSMPLSKAIIPIIRSSKTTRSDNAPNANGDLLPSSTGLEQNERDEVLEEVAALGIELPDEVDFEDGEEDEEDDDMIDNEDGEDDEDENEDEEVQEEPTSQMTTNMKRSTKRVRISSSEPSSSSSNANGTERRLKVCKTGLVKPAGKRVLHRLKDFTSQRLAEKHGEAIGAHIMGMSETAVQKLRDVAKSAPGAPQVYSSLGMVFESMLKDVEGEDHQDGEGGNNDNYSVEADSNDEQGGDEDDTNTNVAQKQLKRLQKRLELAQKAYGSYHVASLLCKRDHVLWERSGDAAIRVSQLYTEIIDQYSGDDGAAQSALATAGAAGTSINAKTTTFDSNDNPKKWRSDHKLWLEHALSAYQSSDNLRPPGVDIPCKLAQVHLSLGQYIDALTILTDLRTRSSGSSTAAATSSERKLGRSEMEGSYPCWLLYSDVMMKIGFECHEWNAGTSTNQNYMFKRWLRKNSKEFDWKERRLQALCLALEAAAGSKSCSRLVKWMEERAKKFHLDQDKKEKENDATVGETDSSDKSKKKGVADEVENGSKETNNAKKDEQASKPTTYAEEREKLLQLNKVELANFDRLTNAMNLVAGSHIFKNRMAARAAVIEKHRSAFKELAMQKFAPGKEQEQNEQPSDDESASGALPLQASCATIYDIASLLLRQCMQLRLFDVGLLVVQSVVSYSKERALRYERRLERDKEYEMLQNQGDELVQAGFKYDKINFGSDDSDEEDFSTYISDDEDLKQSDVLQEIKDGKLPVDIKAMQAICMLGAGGQDFVALNYVEQAILSNELDSFDNGTIVNQGIGIDDPRWKSFSHTVDAPINNPFLLASISDLVTQKRMPRPLLHRVLGIFRRYLKLDSNEGLDQALSSLKALEKAHTLKILLAALKLLVDCARMDIAKLDQPGKNEVVTFEKAVTDSIFALKIITRFHHMLWSPRYADWSLPHASKELITVLHGAISILVQAATVLDKSDLDSVQMLFGFEQSRDLVSTISYADNAAPKVAETSNVDTWRTFPLNHRWQNSFHEKISLRAHNLCAACCVSSFSGWEPSEFNLDTLRTIEGPTNFFGVTLEGESVAGFLPKAVASIVAEQWYHISTILPDLEVLPFESHLDERRKSPWYQKVARNIEKQTIDSSKIALNAEEEGIRALLSFSSLCLIAAEESEGDEREEYVKLSVSVLLPITQFGIDKEVWKSRIGKAAITGKNQTKVGYYLDEHNQYHGGKNKEGRNQFSTKTPRMIRPNKPNKPVQKRSQPATAVQVPASVLLDEWEREDDKQFERTFALEDAQRSMKKLDDAMKNLRKSRTLNSLERASIDISVALLGIVTYDECNNPFVCLQQASMFAAMGGKRGNNDEPFKKFLPLKHLCSPQEALNILGRADCLRAIHFLLEAQFLCSWVASLCSSHRSQETEDQPWNSRWKVIGILTYIISAAIDGTADALAQDESNNLTLLKWDDTAKEEFVFGKVDALALIKIDSTIQEPIDTHNCVSKNSENQPARGEGTVNPILLPGLPQLPAALLAAPDDVRLRLYSFEQQSVQSEGGDASMDDYDPFAGIEVVGI